MDIKKITLAAVVSSLMFTTVQADQNNESEKDSVHEWGPWALPVSPAAGPEVSPGILAFAGGTGPEHVFLDPDINIPETGCEPGQPCGYASFYPFSYDSGDSEPEVSFVGPGGDLFAQYGIQSLTPVAAGFAGQILRIDGGEGVRFIDGPEGRHRVVQFAVTPNGDPGLYIDILSMPLEERTHLGPFNIHYEYDDGLYRLDALTDATFRCLGNCRRGYYRLDRGHLQGFVDATDGQLRRGYDGPEGAVSHGFWATGAYNPSEEFIQAYLGSYVLGTTSTLDQLSSLIGALEYRNDFAEFATDLTATYTGHTAFGARVILDINFSTSTWSGEFNRGRDGMVMAYASENGTSLMGQVGFTVEGGVIEGINLTASSSNLGATDYGAETSVTGNVSASFFGAGAGEVAGVADIVKTKMVVPNGIEEQRIYPAGYQDATHVTTFSTELSEKVKIPEIQVDDI
ncbi:hypothetical protein [Neptuniibacter caesariensis]|uniref:Transferrin-binding protein B C-lobe/N-lobe beta barrel domain-containing protein n=1 Tax=Neptuniibacter caesariensis TaxID=207954 RepID=A0A7U8GTF3_NEPCE|nr:hypothetical protein [Neptuniibacter caesariensis]EAR62227.1 hypothetical protein MED92_14358 [Oceanospirillum sp. MED92] [Neptuniibacter caesariensis]